MKPNKDLEEAGNGQKKYENAKKKKDRKEAKEDGRVVKNYKAPKPPKMKETKI